MFADAAIEDFFRARLDHMIDLRYALAVLASRMPWQQIEASVAHPTDSKLLETARCKLVEAAQDAGIELKQTFAKEGRLLRLIADQVRSRKNTSGAPKLYAWHAPEVDCISEGKARQPHLSYRGVDADSPGVAIKHRGKFKTLTAQERKPLKRRQAIEPIIGHLKADHRMDRCHLWGAQGDRLHAVLCAAGYNTAGCCA